MANWIGVVASREGLDRLRKNDVTWWCVPQTAMPGDFLAMYVARNRMRDIPEEEGGVVAIYKIIGPEPEKETVCRSFGVSSFGAPPVAVQIELEERFVQSIRLAEMKRDKILSTAQFVRRSFQGTTFPATNTQFGRIKRWLNSKKDLIASQ